MATEQYIQKQIINLIESKFNGYTVNGIFTKSGQSDLHCCIAGRYLSIEVKVPGKKPEPLQLHHLDLVIKSGGLAMWADSVDQVDRFVQHHFPQFAEELSI